MTKTAVLGSRVRKTAGGRAVHIIVRTRPFTGFRLIRYNCARSVDHNQTGRGTECDHEFRRIESQSVPKTGKRTTVSSCDDENNDKGHARAPLPVCTYHPPPWYTPFTVVTTREQKFSHLFFPIVPRRTRPTVYINSFRRCNRVTQRRRTTLKNKRN